MLLLLFKKLLTTRFGHYVVDALAILLVVGLGIGAYKVFWAPPNTTIVQTTPDVKTIYVDRPVLTQKTITKLVTDPKDRAEIAKLLAENQRLKSDVTQLVTTIAELKSSGGGTVVVTPPTEPNGPTLTTFKDWRLDFKTDGKTADYTLTQKFKVFSTTGRQKDGKRFSLVSVSEIGANGEFLPLSTETVGIFADETRPHWLVSPTVQAGLGVDVSGHPGAVVGMQWLKYGRTAAAEDSTFSLLTPVGFLSQNIHEFGVLPVSFNVGSVKYVPLKDFWISPYIGASIGGRNVSRIGFALTASF